MKNIYNVVGLMSGTSLDGLDIAFVVFEKTPSGWSFSLRQCEVIKYSAAWLKKLSGASKLSAVEWVGLDIEYGHLLGKTVSTFVAKHKLKVDFISSHGHTVFHQPRKGFTAQIGNGSAIHASSGLPVVCDFRSLDVLLGGEGAPLVPVGDKFLFADYDACLNLGGIANLSRDIDGHRRAFDICFCNTNLNYLISGKGKAFDKNGELASSGEIHPAMLKQLDKINLSLRKKRPSLGREFWEEKIKTVLDQKKISIEDKLCTSVEATAKEIAFALREREGSVSVLCTGGGVLNSFLMARILDHGGDDVNLVVPEHEIIKFKEALVFAFLGVLRSANEVNCLRSVTHATRDSSSGVMIGFNS